MRFLLDTQLLLWSGAHEQLLPQRAMAIIADPKNDLCFSTVSIWEVAIKFGRGKDDFRVEPRATRRRLLEAGFEEFDIRGEHAIAVASLPPIHKDPFDRLLIAQAMVEGITLLTCDALIARYPGNIVQV
jgi:PIN domain nuclease of toxin-antitoxin system